MAQWEESMNEMNPQLMYVIAGAIVVIVAIAALVAFARLRGRRTDQLRQRFGPEYERAIGKTGDVRRAEAALQARETRVERLRIRLLTADEIRQFSTEWQNVQARFVDEPAGALMQADRVIGDIMAARGYPIGDFEQRVDDISVDHPNVVMNYRAARAIAEEHARHPVSTEEMRQAMVHYRALFRDLVEDTTPTVDRGVEPPVGALREPRERP
jgi:hypothetical protein